MVALTLLPLAVGGPVETAERLADVGLVEQGYAELVRASDTDPEGPWDLHAGGLLWDHDRWDLAAMHFQPVGGLPYGYSLYRSGQYGAALVELQDVDPELAGFAALRIDETDRALALWGGGGATAQVQGWGPLPHRRPGLAAGLSAVLPGAGQAYNGRWGEATSALLVNTLLIGSTATLLAREEYFAGASVGLLAVSFYGGNIFSAMWGARRHNRLAREERVDALAPLEPRYRVVDGEVVRF
ncbi:MAG: hypothetical protein GY913_26985 [Proteobacteria bacterium]|nr:hypothetical protein [Pseudomonadota bacterium]MCP4920560.1 hypothetical protein [Pseudomonadota bacterium]